MVNFFNNVLEHINGPEFVKQIFAALFNLFTGSILLIVGFFIFKKQEKFKASSNEVKDICETLNKNLKIIYDLELLCRFIDQNLEQFLRLDPQKLASVIGEGDVSKNRTLIIVLRSLKMKSSPIERSEKFYHQELLLSVLYNLEMLQLGVTANYQTAVDTIEAHLAPEKYPGEPRPSEMEINNIWSFFLESKSKFQKSVSMFKEMTKDGIHGRMDIVEFNSRLKSINDASSEK